MAEQWLLGIKKRAALGKAPITSGRSNKVDRVSFEDLVFVPAQMQKRPVDYFREKIGAGTVIGKMSKKPLRLETPIMIGAMSFGSLSKEAKIAVAKASTIAGTSANTGEGGMLKEERKEAKILIAQYSTGRFGVDEEYLKKADAIEVKIGQGAKPGQGGLLPAEKVTKEIAAIRKIKMGEDVHSPAYHTDIKDLNAMRKRIQWIKKITGGKPVIVKLGAGDVERDVKACVKVGADVIAIDGIAGGTGAAPEVMLDDVGLPLIPAIVRARNVLDKIKARQELIVGGGLNKGADVAKALAFGADGVFMGTAILVAMACTYCRLCYQGNCPLGITTQKPELREKVNIGVYAQKAANYIRACTEEVKMVAGACGYDDVHKLGKNDLRALTTEMERISGVRLV